MEQLTQIFLPFSIWLQDVSMWLNPIMKIFSFLGNVEFYLLLIPILYWCLDTSLGIRIGILLLISGSLNNNLKFAFHAPRPFWISDQVKMLIKATGFGFPSGHAQNAASIWGLIIATFKKKWVTALMAITIFLIGLSRIILGAHFLHDVLAGWIIGGFLLWFFLRFESSVISLYKNLSFGYKLILLVLFILVLLVPAILLVRPGFSIEYIPVGGNPYSFDEILTSTGAFLGLGLGISLLHLQGTYNAKGVMWKRILRYFVGIVGVLILYLGLDLIFPEGESLIPYLLRFFRYCLIGIWISYLAPILFSSLNLAEIHQGKNHQNIAS